MMREPFVSLRHAGHDHTGGFGVWHRAPTAASGTVSGTDSPARVEATAEAAPAEQQVVPHTSTQLAPGSAADAIVYFDAPSGAGGDMVVAALVDLGVPWVVITEAIAALGLDGVELELRRGHSGALTGLRFVVTVDERVQTERSYAQIRHLLGHSRLAPGASQRSLRVFERLAHAEAKAHHVALEAVHFHEVGAVDSIVDIVAACAALDYLGGQVWCSPLPLGRGFTRCQHGVIPLPAPATVECLLGLRTYDSGLDKELVTPTAAALFGALSAGCSGWPSGTLVGAGWGRGSMTLPDRPNLLRVVIARGDASDQRPSPNFFSTTS